MGCSQLHAVVAAQAKCFCIHSGFFDQRLGDISALGDDAPQTLIAGGASAQCSLQNLATGHETCPGNGQPGCLLSYSLNSTQRSGPWPRRRAVQNRSPRIGRNDG